MTNLTLEEWRKPGWKATCNTDNVNNNRIKSRKSNVADNDRISINSNHNINHNNSSLMSRKKKPLATSESGRNVLIWFFAMHISTLVIMVAHDFAKYFLFYMLNVANNLLDVKTSILQNFFLCITFALISIKHLESSQIMLNSVIIHLLPLAFFKPEILDQDLTISFVVGEVALWLFLLCKMYLAKIIRNASDF